MQGVENAKNGKQKERKDRKMQATENRRNVQGSMAATATKCYAAKTTNVDTIFRYRIANLELYTTL